MPPQRRLARIVADNVLRLKRIVDDVLTVSAGAAVSDAVVDAVAEVGQVCEDWRRAALPEPQAGQVRLTLSDLRTTNNIDLVMGNNTPDRAFAPDRQEPPGPPPGDPTRGATLYATHCANCHGARGQGDELGPNLVEKPVLLRRGD